MSYALTVGQSGSAVEVICAECWSDVGTMTHDTIRQAILAKGTLLCPKCRQAHCEYCGFVQQARLAGADTIFRVTDSSGGGEHRICSRCYDDGADCQLPTYSKVLHTIGHNAPYGSHKVRVQL